MRRFHSILLTLSLGLLVVPSTSIAARSKSKSYLPIWTEHERYFKNLKNYPKQDVTKFNLWNRMANYSLEQVRAGSSPRMATLRALGAGIITADSSYSRINARRINQAVAASQSNNPAGSLLLKGMSLKAANLSGLLYEITTNPSERRELVRAVQRDPYVRAILTRAIELDGDTPLLVRPVRKSAAMSGPIFRKLSEVMKEDGDFGAVYDILGD